MATKYMVNAGILFMNPYGKNGPWLPVTKLSDGDLAMIEQVEREVEAEKAKKKKGRSSEE